ncbi:helix-turn-helix domain-containing protein [Propionivibrio sp.]|uniref:helix-turn-helix domain-containing protein n=1 Tax=Propionivibrio sp. TaxID=2212460 RepID=UPI003BF3F262
MKKPAELHKEWLRDPAYRDAYDALQGEFSLVSAIIETRSSAGLTQEQLAEKMNTSQAAIARLESGRAMPSTRTLEKFAEATGTRLKITFEPLQAH